MPPLIVWGFGLLGGATVVRWAVKEVQRINHELAEARDAHVTEAMQPKPVRKLRRDPVTGTFRPE